jgi:hypothetical protein
MLAQLRAEPGVDGRRSSFNEQQRGSIEATKGEVMKWLVALLALLGAVAAAFFFWRKNQRSASSLWGQARDSTSSWTDTVAGKAGEAADAVADMGDKATSAASQVADEVKGATSVSPESRAE